MTQCVIIQARGKLHTIMSRSHRKTPITGNTTADSDKDFKQRANRKARHTNKIRLDHLEFDFIDNREAFSSWWGDKDGKSYFDPDKYPELMRK